MKKVRLIVLGERHAAFSNPSVNKNKNNNYTNLKTKLKILEKLRIYAGKPGTDLQDLQGDSSVFSSQTQV